MRVNSGGNDFRAKSAGCGPKGRSPFGGRNAPGGGNRPPGGKFVIAGGKGNSSDPGSGTGGVVIGAAPVEGKVIVSILLVLSARGLVMHNKTCSLVVLLLPDLPI